MSRRRVSTLIPILTAAGLVFAGTVTASTSGWADDADFSAGTLTSTAAGGGAVTLQTEGVGTPNPAIPWWDLAWGQRRCLTVTNNEANDAHGVPGHRRSRHRHADCGRTHERRRR